jgi:endonuclease/exonuclease/phosphatase family metal-dependent hydrolase
MHRTFLIILVFFFSTVRANPTCNRMEKANGQLFPASRDLKESLRIITYNIRGESIIDEENGNSWEKRKYKIEFLIRSYQPDLIALQEVSKSYLSDLEVLFPEYTSIFFDVSETSNDVVLLFRSDRVSLEKLECFWLSEDPFQKRMPSWGARTPRIVIEAMLLDVQTGKNFLTFCTHFDSRGMETRIKSAEVLGKRLNEVSADLPLILAGDFNFIVSHPIYAEKSEMAYTHLIKVGKLRDVRDVEGDKHYGPDGSWIGWPYDRYAVPSGTIGERLDHLFVRRCFILKEGVLNLKVTDHVNNILSSSDEGFDKIAYSSDHLPVIADLLIE